LTTGQGDDVSKGEPKEMSWEFKQADNRTHKNFTVTIYECTADAAPTRKTSDVREITNITFAASGHNSIVHQGPDGRSFKIVRFTLRMTLLGMGKVHFATYVNGELAGQKDVRVNGEGR
jgi:hypothetical protein